MNKPILIWGAPAELLSTQDHEAAFKESGNNFGNILIGHGVRAVLEPYPLIERNAVASAAEADERCSHVVIPAANFLWKDFDFGFMSTFLERTHLPVTMIGVGAQTNDRTQTSAIHPNTLRLMKLVSERSSRIGVRGFYTAEVLAAHGIHNVEVIGCPSLYSTRLPTLSIDVGRLQNIERLGINLSRRVVRHSFLPERMRALENVVLQMAIQTGAHFAAQDEVDELMLACKGVALSQLVTDYFSSVPADDVTTYFRERTRWFPSVDRWGAYVREQDITIGTRFHGNLISLVNGVPALMIVHDSRTMEMCTLMNIPMLHVSAVDSTEITPDSLLESVASLSFDAFERTYRLLYRRYSGFLTANGLPHNLMRNPDLALADIRGS